MHVIWELPNGAKLFMSVEKSGFDAHEHGVKVVALLADWQPERLPGGVRVIHAPIPDDDELSPDEAKKVEETAARVAHELAVSLLHGDSALASCASGLNRSGLVCGIFLARYAGLTPREAIRTIRARRSPYALRNRTFRRMLLGPSASDEDDDPRVDLEDLDSADDGQRDGPPRVAADDQGGPGEP